MPAIALLVKESLSLLIKVVTTPRNIEYAYVLNAVTSNGHLIGDINDLIQFCLIGS